MVEIITSPRDVDRRKRASFAQSHVGPRRKTAGSHIADLVALKKAVLLSPDAARKFNAERVDYVRHPTAPIARGLCDATGVFCERGILFVPREG